MYTIEANGKTYEVSEHAQLRMVQNAIEEAWVIETLEDGDITEQEHGRDLYELQMWIEEWEEWLILQVIVEEGELLIVTVIDYDKD